MFGLVKSCAEATVDMYMPIVDRHKNDGYGRKEREWQLLRRGRYDMHCCTFLGLRNFEALSQ